MRPFLAQATDLFCRFLAWWRAELLALVPETVRRMLPRRGVVVVEAAGAELTVVRRSGERRRELARLPAPEPSTAGGGRLPLLKGRLLSAGHPDVVLQLPADRALCKTVTLPLAAEGNLSEILYFELDRQTPFRPEDVYFDWRVLERLPGAQRLTVELTVLARSVVDPILAWLARWHLEPARVESAGGGDQRWVCRLPARGGEASRERSRAAGVLNPALAALALVLAATAVYLPILQQQRLLAQLQDELRTEARLAEATSALQERLAALRGEALQVASKKTDGAAVLDIWNEVTRIIPDHSFALELRLREGVVELVGQSSNATALLQVVENSSLFHGAAFRSPITRGQGTEAERFHLAFSVEAPVVQEDGP